MKRILYNVLIGLLLLSFMAACAPAATPTEVVPTTEAAPVTEAVVATEEVTEAPATAEVPTETAAPAVSGPQGTLRVALPTEPSSLIFQQLLIKFLISRLHNSMTHWSFRMTKAKLSPAWRKMGS